MTEEQEESLSNFATVLDELHKRWSPHAGQIPIGRALFYEGAKKIFVVFGRNGGKTQFAAYASWRWAMENPGSTVYIFEPYNTQAREILWASNVIQSFGPDSWIDSVNNTEMRITFKNGSFIKITGSDNYEAYRGIKPTGLCIFDEYKDIRSEFIDAFEPNLAAYNPPALYIGTPPEFENHFTVRMNLAKESPHWRYFHAPTSINPYISKEWLDQKREEYIATGEEETWLREYMAVFVKGGKKSIFPQFLKLTFNPLDAPKDLNKWHLFITFDPAASSVFGVLFAFYNPYSKQMIIFDEIYETDPREMTAGKMFIKVEEKIKPYRSIVKSIRWIYDEAARYFRSEIYELPQRYEKEGIVYKNDWSLEPSQKNAVGIDGYLSIVRSVLNKGLVTVTDNCVKFRWEMESYVKNENGKIPKENDHLINCFQYKLQAMGFNLAEIEEPKKEDPFLARRAISMEAEFFADNKLVDFDQTITNNSFEEL